MKDHYDCQLQNLMDNPFNRKIDFSLLQFQTIVFISGQNIFEIINPRAG